MALDKEKIFAGLRAVAFLAMGLIICFVEPHAIRENPDSGFLNFIRYLIGVLLIFGGGKKLYPLFSREDKDRPLNG